jgi:hypothetical protein
MAGQWVVVVGGWLLALAFGLVAWHSLRLAACGSEPGASLLVVIFSYLQINE